MRRREVNSGEGVEGEGEVGFVALGIRCRSGVMLLREQGQASAPVQNQA